MSEELKPCNDGKTQNIYTSWLKTIDCNGYPSQRIKQLSSFSVYENKAIEGGIEMNWPEAFCYVGCAFAIALGLWVIYAHMP